MVKIREEPPLDLPKGDAAHGEEVMLTSEDVSLKTWAALSCANGAFYGPAATDDQCELVRKRQYPLVGRATGYSLVVANPRMMRRAPTFLAVD